MTVHFGDFTTGPALFAARETTWVQQAIREMHREMHGGLAEKLNAPRADSFWPEEGSFLSQYRPYKVKDGVLHVPVRGTLLKDFPYATSWATGYEYIVRAVERGVEDAAVQGIALLIDSPGGVVSGAFD